MFLSRKSRTRSRTKAIVLDTSRPSLPAKNSANSSHLRRLQAHGRGPAAGHEPAQRRPVLAEVDHLGAVLGRLVELGVGRLLFADGNVEAAAELAAARASLSFFCWCVMLRPSPASPRP